jgi:hypothetical protein
LGYDFGMPRKPPLALVGSDIPANSPPRELGPHGQKLWDEVMQEYHVHDSGGREILAQLCSSVDTAELLRETIARDGVLIPGRDGTMKSHPLVKDELACRCFVVRALHMLGIAVSVTPQRGPGRPPKPYGW